MCADIDSGVVCLGGGGDRTAALKFRLALGPVGARKGCAGPRGGDLEGGGGDFNFGDAARTGDLSRGVDLLESRIGDLSRGYGERVLGRSSNGGAGR